jgi:hypothetical protein
MNQAQPMTKMQESNVVHGAIAHALAKASKAAEMQNNASASTPTQGKMKSIVVRKDRLGNFVVFDIDTHAKNEQGEFIDAWDGKSVKSAPIDYYKIATKPVSTEESAKVSSDYAKAFKLTHVHVRQRLEKNKIHGDNEGKANTVDIEDFKTRLKAAIIKAIDDM